jgi:predicted hydrocarbon binding protein
MSRTDPLAPPAPAPSRVAGPPSIAPVFPLLLLETMRDMDRPSEVLEDEDLTISLPRRFGLSDVVLVQIRRFQQEVRQRRLQDVAPVEDLIRLVIRRPDAEEIFVEAGRRIARHFFAQRSRLLRTAVRILPRPIASFAANRAGKRLFRRLVGGSRFSLQRWPIELKVEDTLTARADPGGAACAFYSGVLEETIELYVGRRYRVRHARCEARGGERCHWVVEVSG